MPQVGGILDKYWSYCCPDERCCPAEGNPLALPGTTVMAAAAAYAGIQVRGSLREMEARLSPWDSAAAAAAGQEQALDSAGAVLMSRILDASGRREVAGETLTLARALMERLGRASVPAPSDADIRDDGLISPDEAAAVILGLQDRETRDRAAEWMEGREAETALRLWRALARRCVGPYVEHAAAPLALAGWVAWSSGDEPGARVALGLALRADPDYTFAQLLHQACNEGLDPETLRRCLRSERRTRSGRGGGGSAGEHVARRTERRSRPQPGRTSATRRRRSSPGSARPGPAVSRRRVRDLQRQGRRDTRSGR